MPIPFPIEMSIATSGARKDRTAAGLPAKQARHHVRAVQSAANGALRRTETRWKMTPGSRADRYPIAHEPDAWCLREIATGRR